MNTSIQAYYVNSCPYQTGGVTGANLVDLSALAYYIVDNFEMTGVCTQTVGHPYANNIYIEYNEVTGPLQFLDLYVHGWSHVPFVAGQGSASCTSSVVCFNSFAFEGMQGTSTTISDILRYNVVDGSDSDPFGLEAAYAGFYDSAYNVFRYSAGSIFRNMHLYHDNLYEYTVENGHSNIVENYAEWANGDNVLYNSVFRYIDFEGPGQGNSGNTPVLWLWPNYPSGVDFIFNNVLDGEGSVQLINVGRNLQSVGTYSFFNNTIDFTAGTGDDFHGGPAGYPFTVLTENNHYISESSSVYDSLCTGHVTETTNLLMNHATAAANGYPLTQTYADSPASGSSPTVGAGTNAKGAGPCGALATAAGSDPTLSAAAAACQSDTTYACSYNSTTHTVTCPARTPTARPSSGNWDIGAYQYQGGALAPPTNVKAIAH